MDRRRGPRVIIGILITTVGISLLVLALVGASIEVYGQLLSALVQRQVSAVTEQLPDILQPEGATATEGAGSAFDSTQILGSLIENLMNTPLFLILAVAGIVLIYLGLYITQRQSMGR